MRKLCLLAAVLLTMAACAADNALPDPGFEDGSANWAIADEGSQIIAAAAHSGRLGLRAGAAEYTPTGAAVTSASLPVTPGQPLTLRYWARATAAIGSMTLFFVKADGKPITDPALKASGGRPTCLVTQADGQWHECTLTTPAPANAASVYLWIHTWAGVAGTMDVDDVALEGVAADAKPTPPPAARKLRLPTPPANAPARTAPPTVMLKLDDFRLVQGKVPPTWVKLADLFAARGIKGSFGVLAGSLADATPQAIAWIQSQRASGRIEFWFHGWDHATRDVDGTPIGEFVGRTVAEQQQRFADSQKLAREKLGFPFTTFGPPGGGATGSFDAATLRALADDPDMKVMLYPQPLDEPGKQLAAGGKITILDRVWAANLEWAVGVPWLKSLAAAFAANPQREYFVLQGHPLMWQGAKWDEWLRILDFLQAQQCVFTTPTAYVTK